MLKIPNSLELEKSYLGGLLLSKTPYLSQGEALFYDEANKAVFKIIRSTQNCDLLILKEKLGSKFIEFGGNEFLTSLTENAGYDLDKIGKALSELQVKRDLITMASSINSLLNDPSKTTTQAIEIAQNGIQSAVLATADDSCKANSISDLYENFLEKKDKYNSSNGILGFRTGFQLMDLYSEGAQRGTVTRINAYSNTGKTQLMLRILCEMLSQGKKCVVFSTEVRRDTFIQLLASAYYKKNKHDLYQDKFQIPWGEFSELPLYFYDSVDNLSIIKHLVANHVTNGEADVVFIDYAQNISVDGSKDEYSAMSSYARAVQKLAIKHNIALIDLSQMSNEGAKAGQGTSGVISSKGSGALVAAADVAIVLERTEFPGEIKMSLGKNKYGPRRSCTLQCDFSTSSFTETIEL